MATKSKPFRSLLDTIEPVYTTSGDKIEEVLAMRIGEGGKHEFYVAGKKNVYDEIQSYAEDSTIEAIISKVMATGDISILNQKKGEFMDLTEMPKDIFEAQQKIKEAEKTFAELPMSIRETYNNNFNEYLADVGSEKWLITVGLKEAPKEEQKEEKGAAEE